MTDTPSVRRYKAQLAAKLRADMRGHTCSNDGHEALVRLLAQLERDGYALPEDLELGAWA